MNNLRLVTDNAADSATLTASSEAGSLVVGNLKSNIKAKVWRSTGTTATLTAVFASALIAGCVALPFCSLSASAYIRVRAYSNSADIVPAYDSGTVLAVKSPALGSWAWGALPLGVNSYAYGGAAYTVQWIPTGAYQKIVIDLEDTLNPLGYIEASRLVIGPYWEAAINPDWGADAGVNDTTTNARTESGDLLSDVGVQYRSVNLSFSEMNPADRATLWNIIRKSGLSKPMLLSVFPNHTDTNLEQEAQIFGKFSQLNPFGYKVLDVFTQSISFEEI